ncbi:hypothetical protein ACYSNW_16590 [Enterococcus sp. LJL99]
MEKSEVEVGKRYVCHESNFSWFFIGEALSKKEKNVLVKVLKCHPDDRSTIKMDDSILTVNYLNIIENV